MKKENNMKFKNIIICGMGLWALTACNDYLDVDAPSKFSPESIYKSAKDVNTALNGVKTALTTRYISCIKPRDDMLKS